MSDQAEAEEVHNDKKEIENLMEQVKRLENENQQLHDNILKMGNKKQKKSLEYYVRLKKDLLDEEKKLNHQLTELEMHKDLESKEISSQKDFLKKKIDETNKENKSLKEKIDSHNKSLEKKSNSLSKRRVELKNELDEKKIDELESKVISLTNDLNSKEAIVQEQKDKIDELQMKIDSISQNMTEQINDIRSQYENVYSASKQNEENFNKLYEDKTNNMKNDIQSNKYQLEKKLVHSKNLLNFYLFLSLPMPGHNCSLIPHTLLTYFLSLFPYLNIFLSFALCYFLIFQDFPRIIWRIHYICFLFYQNYLLNY